METSETEYDINWAYIEERQDKLLNGIYNDIARRLREGLLIKALKESPLFLQAENRIKFRLNDLRHVYALSLNLIPTQYKQLETKIHVEKISDDMIISAVQKALVRILENQKD